MSDSAKKRLAIDLDVDRAAIAADGTACDARSCAPQRGGDTAGTKPDPLAELARIVGQDDPYRTLLSADRAGVAPGTARPPNMDAVFAYGHDETIGRRTGYQHQDPQSLPDCGAPAVARGGRRAAGRDSPQEVTFERDTAHAMRDRASMLLPGHSRGSGLRCSRP